LADQRQDVKAGSHENAQRSRPRQIELPEHLPGAENCSIGATSALLELLGQFSERRQQDLSIFGHVIPDQ